MFSRPKFICHAPSLFFTLVDSFSKQTIQKQTNQTHDTVGERGGGRIKSSRSKTALVPTVHTTQQRDKEERRRKLNLTVLLRLYPVSIVCYIII